MVVPETRAARMERERFLRSDPKKAVTRRDPIQLQREAAQARADADPNAPKPQVGLSSSQLNTAPPALKVQATKEARVLPSNTDPDGAPTEKKAETAQKKFEKEHEDQTA